MQVTARVNDEHDFIELFFWSNGDPRAEKLFRYWCGLPGGDPLDPPRLVSRLTVGGAR